MELGKGYLSGKIILLLTTIVLLIWQMISTDYFFIKVGTTVANAEKILSYGVHHSDKTPELKNDNINKTLVKNEVMLGCMGDMVGKQTIDKCMMLSHIGILQMLTLTFLILGLIPKYGEASAIAGSFMLLTATIMIFWSYNDNKNDTLNDARSTTSLSSTEEDCVGNLCIVSEYGISFILNIILTVLAVVIITQSGFGLNSMFNC